MVSRIVIAALLVIVAATGAQAAPARAAAGPDIDAQLHDDLASVLGAVRGAGGGSSSGAVSASRRAPELETRFVAACPGNVPDGTGRPEALCGNALAACQDADAVLYWIYRRPAGGTQRWALGGQVCRGAGEVPVGVVPVVSGEEFRRLPLPAGVVRVEPPGGRTLVNVPTNVFVEVGTVVIPTQVLGFAVRVRARPERFVWGFGDGGRLATSDPGAPYPELRTTHTYTRPGRQRVSLVTTYSGEYSVAGGPWLPIEGTAQVGSPASALTVVAARSELVADAAAGTREG